MLLIDDILMLPAKGLIGIFKKIHEMVEQELSDKTNIQKRLTELQLRLELGEISEEEYEREEKELLSQMDDAGVAR